MVNGKKQRISEAPLISVSCNKGDGGPGVQAFKLSYGSNLIFLKNQATDFIVLPDQAKAGTYTAFPEGIELNSITGAINVSKSETGLRYKITHTATNGDTTSAIVLLSGLTFTDKFYKLSQNDSIAFPVYNASEVNPLPLSGSVFDDGISNTTSVRLEQVTDAKIKKSLIGLKKDDEVTLDIQKAYNNDAPKVAAILGIDEGEATT